MEGDAVGLEPQPHRELDELAREVGVGAELLGEGPVGAQALGEEAEEDLRARRGAEILSRSDGESVTKSRTPFS